MELSVELRLALDKLRSDIAKASAAMKSGLESGAKGTSAATDKAGTSMDNLEKKVKKTTQALKDQKKAALDAWRASLPEPKVTISGEGKTPIETEEERKARVSKIIGERPQRPAAPAFEKEISKEERERRIQKEADEARRADLLARDAERARKAALSAQGKPPIISQKGLNAGGIANIASVSGIPALGQLIRGIANPAVLSVAAALIALRKTVREVSDAFESARRTYAKQLQSGGLPGGFIQKRSALASIIGVGENEVYQFGTTVSFLNDKIRVATRTLTETNRTLTAASYGIKAMNLTFTAAWSSFASAIAPAVNKITSLITAFTEFLVVTGRLEFAGKALNLVLQGVANAVGVLMVASSALQLAFTAVIDSIQYLYQRLVNMIPGFKGDHSDKFKETKEGFEALKKMIDALFNKNNQIQAPTPTVSTNRLPASAWEKMGLVIGNGPGVNYSKETARNTKEIAVAIKSFLSRPIPGGGGISQASPVYSRP